ncbi:MAG: thioredoxin [Chlorobi bacterium]|nr:thioredoxin [Chlorobiota bacterium]
MSYFLWGSAVVLIILFIISSVKKARLLNEAGQKKQSENIIILNDDNFRKTIKKGVVLVDFWAPWCTPCRIQNPVISDLADEFNGKASICKLNVDENKKSAMRMNIKNIPNIIIFKDGKPAKQLIGVKSKHTLAKAVDSLLD